MAGKRAFGFRAGDRSEYLATYALSRFAFVNPIARQEDYGVLDLFCILSRQQGKCDYPESGFFVQVKSEHADWVLDADAVTWISHHMDHPLFLCICEKEEQRLTLYSCARLWILLFLRHDVDKVTLRLGEDGPSEDYYAVEGMLPGTDPPRKPQAATVYLGKPILCQTLGQFESDPSIARDVLGAWIRLDADNIARRRLGRVAVRFFRDWETNVVPTQTPDERHFADGLYMKMEEEVGRFLSALAKTYANNNCDGKLRAAREMLRVLGSDPGVSLTRYRWDPGNLAATVAFAPSHDYVVVPKMDPFSSGLTVDPKSSKKPEPEK